MNDRSADRASNLLSAIVRLGDPHPLGDHAEIAIGSGPRSEKGKVGEVAPVEGKGFNALLVYDGSERRLSGIHQRGDGAHGDGGFHLANSKLRVNDGASADGNADVLQHKFVESGFLNGDFISARIKIKKGEIALGAGL